MTESNEVLAAVRRLCEEEHRKSFGGANPPNSMSVVRGIGFGSVVETTQGLAKRFVVEGFDLEGDPYGEGERAYALLCKVVAHAPNKAILATTQEKRVEIIRFLGWLEASGIELRAVHSAMDGDHSELLQSHEELVQTYVGIDHKDLEEERRALAEYP